MRLAPPPPKSRLLFSGGPPYVKIGPARASFVKNPTDGAHINLRQPLKNKAFYEAKVALHFDL